MKKTLCIICLVVLLGLGIGYQVSYTHLAAKKEAAKSTEEAYPADYVPISVAAPDKETTEESDQEAFFVRLEKDQLCVYGGEPLEVMLCITVKEEELICSDRELDRLREGIYVKSIRDAYHLLETYTS